MSQPLALTTTGGLIVDLLSYDDGFPTPSVIAQSTLAVRVGRSGFGMVASISR